MAQLAIGPGGNQLRFSELFKIHIEHLPTSNKVSFEGFVTSFSDNYASQWNEEMVYGRMDPLSTFQSTRRSISIAFDIPNDSKEHALQNMRRVRRLIQFLYPTYNDSGLSQQNVLKAGPLLAMKWVNLISSPNNDGEKLIGYINGGLNYSPEVMEGGFLARRLSGDSGGMAEDSRASGIENYYPKKLSLSFSFTVLHTHLVGWAPAPGIRAGTSFIFGGDEMINAAFPNAAVSPPSPAPPATAQNSGQSTDDASETLDPNDPDAETTEDLLDDRRRNLNRGSSSGAFSMGAMLARPRRSTADPDVLITTSDDDSTKPSADFSYEGDFGMGDEEEEESAGS